MRDDKALAIKAVQNVSHAAPQIDFGPRESAEMVLGFSGAIGCGMNFAVSTARRLLEEFGYEVVHLKLSRFIEALLAKGLVQRWDVRYDTANRYERLQLAGNQLRNTRAPDFLAELAIAVISKDRVERELCRPGHNRAEVSVDSIVPGRVAYLVDQLKHPDEVRLLRRVYGNLFYLVGVLASEKQRTENLRQSIAAGDVGSIIGASTCKAGFVSMTRRRMSLKLRFKRS